MGPLNRGFNGWDNCTPLSAESGFKGNGRKRGGGRGPPLPKLSRGNKQNIFFSGEKRTPADPGELRDTNSSATTGVWTLP